MAAAERAVRVPKARPDPGPMRLLLGVTGLAAATAMATAIVRPNAPTVSPPSADPSQLPNLPPLVVSHVTRYVQLQPGETAPPGATVVQKPAGSPRVVVVTVPAPVQRRTVVVVTRQSGAK